MTANPKIPSKDEEKDEVEKSRAPLLEHLVELRKRLMVVMAAVLIAFVACFLVAKPAFEFLIVPYEQAKVAYEAREAVTGVTIDEEASADLIFSGPLEYFFVQMKLALLGAIAVAFPVVAWQLYAFAAPGLYKRERGAILPFLFAMPVLFVAGAALVYYIVLPLVMGFSLRQQYESEGVTISLLLRVDDYFKLATALILAFGATFQLPVILTLLGKAGMVSAKGLRKAWKYAVVAVFVLAAFITPPDPISQTILAVPILLLYEISIWCVKLVERGRAKEEAARAAAE